MVSVSRWRLRLVFFEVRMWRLKACPRLNLPVPVFLKRFAAPLCVFSFGMAVFLFYNIRLMSCHPERGRAKRARNRVEEPALSKAEGICGLASSSLSSVALDLAPHPTASPPQSQTISPDPARPLQTDAHPTPSAL